MIYIEAPRTLDGPPLWTRLFLAGGITGCPDWQVEMVGKMDRFPIWKDVTVFNPRRANFPVGDPTAGREQIEWEFNQLRDADVISFWFPKESICPIVLFELGRWSNSGKRIFVGVHPEYPRRFDVEAQLFLSNPHLPIVYSVGALVGQISAWLTALE